MILQIFCRRKIFHFLISFRNRQLLSLHCSFAAAGKSPNGPVGQMGLSAEWAFLQNGPVGRMGWSAEWAGLQNGLVCRMDWLAKWAGSQMGRLAKWGGRAKGASRAEMAGWAETAPINSLIRRLRWRRNRQLLYLRCR